MRRLRHILFAEKLAPSATLDLDSQRRAIEEAEFELSHPNQAKADARRRAQLGEAKLDLAASHEERDRVRTVLWPPDEPAEE